MFCTTVCGERNGGVGRCGESNAMMWSTGSQGPEGPADTGTHSSSESISMAGPFAAKDMR
jgi:hypothetical protein